MRIAITGATGNVGTALMTALAADPSVTSIVAIARRAPTDVRRRARWVPADVARDPLERHFENADAVVHLAWEIQPSHDPARLWRTNVLGSSRVFAAAEAAGVPAVVHASSVGVYSPGPDRRPVREDWPRLGVPTCLYAVHKAEVERRLDVLEQRAPRMRVVRMRPALTFSGRAASGIQRLFAGPLLPRWLLRRGPFVVPDIAGLRLQAVHSDDVARAYVRAITEDVRGAFNIAAEPVLDMDTTARALGARRLPVQPAVARAVMAATWRMRTQPTPPGWLDMGLGVPVMDTTRARTELGWEPAHASTAALTELVHGMGHGRAGPTPALRPGRRRESPPGPAAVEEPRR